MIKTFLFNDRIYPTNSTLPNQIGVFCFARMIDMESCWQRHIRNHEKSSLTIQAYCDQHELTIGMFYYCKRKLKHQPKALEFEEIGLSEHRSSEAVHLRFPNGVEMWIHDDRSAVF